MPRLPATPVTPARSDAVLASMALPAGIADKMGTLAHCLLPKSLGSIYLLLLLTCIDPCPNMFLVILETCFRRDLTYSIKEHPYDVEHEKMATSNCRTSTRELGSHTLSVVGLPPLSRQPQLRHHNPVENTTMDHIPQKIRSPQIFAQIGMRMFLIAT